MGMVKAFVFSDKDRRGLLRANFTRGRGDLNGNGWIIK